MNEKIKRLIFGLFYVIIMWVGSSYQTTYNLLFTILAIISIYEMWMLRRGKSKFLAFLFTIIPFIIIQLLAINNNDSNLTFDPTIILFIMILTWTFDTFAYIIGIKFGKHKIMPSISPNKSWEGFVGGYIFTMIVTYLTYQYFKFENQTLQIIISTILPFTATTGDFIESYYKRKAGVKDSGNIIPGHGGVLDRMDAFMVTIPVVYILTKLL